MTYGQALFALFVGDAAAIFIYNALITNAARSPYLLVPSLSLFGFLGLVASIVLSAWMVQLLAAKTARRTKSA